MSRALRVIAAPFVAAAPAGARVRTRLRVTPAACGRAARSLPAPGDRSRAVTLPPAARKDRSTRRAGPRPRRSQARADGGVVVAVGRGDHPDQRGRLAARLPEPGHRAGHAESHGAEGRGPPRRPRRGQARAARRVRDPCGAARQDAAAEGAESPSRPRRAAGRSGAVSGHAGGLWLMRARLNLADAGLTEAAWRERWDAERCSSPPTARRTRRGNETIRWTLRGLLEVKLPAPLARLANRPHGRYRLPARSSSRYRGDEVAAQAARRGAVRHLL